MTEEEARNIPFEVTKGQITTLKKQILENLNDQAPLNAAFVGLFIAQDGVETVFFPFANMESDLVLFYLKALIKRIENEPG